MKRWIREFLGLDSMHYHLELLRDEVEYLREDLVPSLAKLTSLLEDENSEARKRASDMLGKQAIERMIGEDKARRHTLGEL